MGTGRTDEFRKDAVSIALTSGFSRCQIADDLGVGLTILNKWVNAPLDTDVVTAEDRELARETQAVDLGQLVDPTTAQFTLADLPIAGGKVVTNGCKCHQADKLN